MTPNEKALAALKEALTRLTELSYRVHNDLWHDDWVAIQTALPEAISALSEPEPVGPYTLAQLELMWGYGKRDVPLKEALETLDAPVGGEAVTVDDTLELLSVGWTWLNNHANGDVCSDRSCVRCKVADALFALEKRFPESAHALILSHQGGNQ